MYPINNLFNLIPNASEFDESRLVVLHGCMASRTNSTINSMIILHHQPYSIVASLANHQSLKNGAAVPYVHTAAV